MSWCWKWRSGWKRRAGLAMRRTYEAAAAGRSGLLGKFGVGDEMFFHFFLFLGEAGGEELFGLGQLRLTFFFAADADEQLAAHRADAVIFGRVFFGSVELGERLFV